MSRSVPLRAVLEYASSPPSRLTTAPPFWLRLPSVSRVVPRVASSNQYSCENSSPPRSLANTKPSRHAPAGAGTSPVTGSRWKVSCSRMPSGVQTRWAWAVSAKRVLTSRQPSRVQPARLAPRVFW